MNYIKYIFLICLLFLISKVLQADSNERPLPNRTLNESTEGCFTYLLRQGERIDINVENVLEYVVIRTIQEVTHNMTNEKARQKLKKEMREKLLYFESFGMEREKIRDLVFPGVTSFRFRCIL